LKYLEFEQWLPVSLERAWTFFSSPANLNEITPGNLDIKIIGHLPDQMYPGMLIRYSINPVLHIPVHWVTEITFIQDKVYFIDVQLNGPYRVWHHEHHFREANGGVIMTDKLYYDIGWSFIGWLAGKVWVNRQVEKIFEFRMKKLEQLFPAPT
jgi:ligand-binding SRPBCC domain-containing protein